MNGRPAGRWVDGIAGLARLELELATEPEPQGSKTAVVRGGKAVVVEGRRSSARKRFDAYRKAVREAAVAAMDAHGLELLEDVPVRVQVIFRLTRPKAHYVAGDRDSGRLRPDAPRWHTSRKDVDKLARAVLDSLAGVVFDDDSRVAILDARKVWTNEPTPRVVVIVEELPELELARPAA